MMIFLFLINNVWAQINDSSELAAEPVAPVVSEAPATEPVVSPVVVSAPIAKVAATKEIVIPVTKVKINGHLDFVARGHSLPTSKRGRVDYVVEEMPVHFAFSPADGQSVNLEQDFIAPKVKVASYDLEKVLAETDQLQVGVLRRLWFQELSLRKASGQRSVFVGAGSELRPLAQKYNYDEETDTGFFYRRDWPEARFALAAGSLNGEGGAQAENGANKESFFFLRKDWENFTLMLFYSSGAYDQYSGAENKKERWQMAVQYIEGHSEVSLEVLSAFDPAQAIKDRGMVDEVDVTALLGERVQGGAARLQLHQSLDEKWGALAQYDYLRPYNGNRAKDLAQWTVGASYEWSAKAQSWLAWNQGEYGAEHSASIKESKRISFATRFNF